MRTFQPEAARVAEMHDFLTAPQGELPDAVDVTVLFGRKSWHLIDAAASALVRSQHGVVSGWVGKDSGDNPFHGIREDDWLLKQIEAQGVDTAKVRRDPNRPKNGIDNVRGMIDVVRHTIGLQTVGNMAAVIHSTSLRRLGATLLGQIELSDLKVNELTLYPSAYPFDPDNAFDQRETAFEVVRLADLSDGPDAVFDRPDGVDDLLPYARELGRHLDAQFGQQGIRNWSTADDTLRRVSPHDLASFFEAAQNGQS